MRVLAVLACLVTMPAVAQVFPYGGGVCTLDGTYVAVAPYYRATTATDTVPGYQCDAVLGMCIKLGPAARAYIGTNVSGDITVGPQSGNSTVMRMYGTLHIIDVSAVNLTASNVVTYNAALDQGTNAFMRNTFLNKPVKVDDGEGLQITCKATLPTCGTVPEGTVLTICATGGALTQACVCVTDGVTPHWRNLLNPAAGGGTSTTCPAT